MPFLAYSDPTPASYVVPPHVAVILPNPIPSSATPFEFTLALGRIIDFDPSSPMITDSNPTSAMNSDPNPTSVTYSDPSFITVMHSGPTSGSTAPSNPIPTPHAHSNISPTSALNLILHQQLLLTLLLVLLPL